MTFDEMRAQFPSAATSIHLNHAGTSPIARPVATATQAVLDELMSNDSFSGYRNHMKRETELRTGFGRMLNVAPKQLAFVRNTSHGLTVAAQAIPFQLGDTVVVAGNEYPANVYPWMAQAHRGVKVQLVAPREDGCVAEEDLIAAAEANQTRVLTVSWVQWGTGQRMDLARLGSFCRERGILFVVDAVQGLGALRLDLGNLPVDIAAAGCHKWLLAPGGLGVLYLREGLLPDLLPTNAGWNTVVNPIEWERLHFNELKPNADRYEEGTPSLLATAALGASIALLETVGVDAIEKRVLELAAYTRKLLTERGCCILSPEASAQQTGIIAFRHSTLSNETVLEAVAAQKVIAAVRCGNVRFAPHAYINETDIEKAVAAIPAG
jgi:cysteine desulfurase/selenocysteine lyase